MTSRPRTTSRSGFSLISVVFAVILLVLGLLALARSQTLLAAVQGSTNHRNRAYALARAHMELLRSRPPSTITAENAVVIDSLGRVAAGGGFTRTVQLDPRSTNLLAVTVLVGYPRGTVPAQLNTLIFR